MKRWWVAVAAFATGAVLSAPLVVMAAGGSQTSRLERQTAMFRTDSVATTSRTFNDIPGLNGMTICAIGEVSVSVSLGLEGGPVGIQMRMDDGPTLQPGAVRFDPGTTRSFSFTFLISAGTFEGSDGHAFDVEWRSVNGSKVTLHRGVMNAYYETGNCPT